MNIHIGAIVMPPEISSVDISWPDCPSDLFELIVKEHDIAHVSYFAIYPCGCWKYSANIAKITFKGQDSSRQCMQRWDLL